MNQIEQQVLIKNSKEKEAFVFYANVQRDEQMARYLESILLEKEKHSITLKPLLQAFIQYARLSSGLTIPFSIHISPEILNMTLLDPEKLFSDLAHHYHGCCAKHAKTSLFLFRCWPTWQDSATIHLKLAFDIEQPEINEVCAVFVECEVQKNVAFSHL